MKYLSIDIETTGLDPNTADVLEIAAVLEDTEVDVPVIKLPAYRSVIYQDTYRTDAYCANMHQKVWKEIAAIDKGRIKEEGRYLGAFNTAASKIIEDEAVLNNFSALEDGLTEYIEKEQAIDGLLDWIENQGITENITPAGKNFGAFDLQFLKRLCMDGQVLPFKHRALDPACFYLQKGDMFLPDLKLCLARACIVPTCLHTALGDAVEVIYLLRNVFNKEA